MSSTHLARPHLLHSRSRSDIARTLERSTTRCLVPGYYQLSWLLFVIRPAWSYRLNADFEDHAEHEYMSLVVENPDWETQAFDSAFSAGYAVLDSVADLFRQIGYDERVHKEESLARMAEPCFR